MITLISIKDLLNRVINQSYDSYFLHAPLHDIDNTFEYACEE